MNAKRERALVQLATQQHQVVTRSQLCVDLRFSSSAIDRLVEVGRLVVLRRGVYALGGCALDVRGALYAATVGSRTSVGSHRAAARLWRLPGGEDLVEIASPRWRRVRGDGLGGYELVVHESLHLSERDAVELDGIWRTRVARTLVDLGASVALGHIDADALVLAVQDGVRRNLTSVEQLEATFARLAPQIRIGGREFRAALDAYEPVLAGTESPPEVKVGRALLRAGFEVVPQYELKLGTNWTVRLDFFLPEFVRGVEVSPFSTHGGRLQKQYDIARTLRIRRVHGIEISEVGDDEIDNGCRELLGLLRTLRAAA
jgi:hypothetical protein